MPYKLCMMLEIFLILVFLSSHVLAQGRKESWFIPTKLATNLSVSLTDSSSRKEVESLHSWCLLYDVYFVSNCVLYSLLSFSFFFYLCRALWWWKQTSECTHTHHLNYTLKFYAFSQGMSEMCPLSSVSMHFAGAKQLYVFFHAMNLMKDRERVQH